MISHKYFIASIVSIIISFFSYSQTKIVALAAVDKNKIVIGEPLQFFIQVTIPSGQPLHFFEIDTIPHFEFLKKEKVDTTSGNKTTTLKQVFSITSFDSGHWEIPSFVMPGAKKVHTDSIGMDVGFAPFDRDKDYNDIKDIIEVYPEEPDNSWYWYAAGAALIFIILMLYLLTRKKPKTKVASQPAVDPYTKAMQELQQLQKENLPAKGEIKMYYSRLVDIFRFYVFHRKQLQSLQKTTDHLVVQMKSLNLNEERFNKLAQALRLSDFVKFAKYIPGDEDNRAAFDAVKNSIEEIEKIR
jgi:hypothetical protein